MHRQALTTVPGILDDGGMTDVGHLLNHIQLAQAINPLLFGRQLRQLHPLLVIQVADRAQPAIDQTQLPVLHRCPDTTATVMPGYQDVFHLEHIHRVLDHRQAVQVGVQHHVGDITVNEQIARQHADDLVGRHPCVGTTDPEEFRCLLPGKLGEKIRIFLLDRIGPACVVINQFL